MEHVDNTLAVTVGCVDHNSVNTCGNKRVDTIHHIGSDTDTGSHTKASESVLASVRFILCFGDIFICNQSHKTTVAINHRKLFNFVFLKDCCGMIEISGL